MGRGGGGGSHRSHGGGGRSHGGRSFGSGSSRHRGGSAGTSRNFSSYHATPRPPRGPSTVYHRHYYGGTGSMAGGMIGILAAVLITLFIIGCCLPLLLASHTSAGASVSKSTVVREKLTPKEAFDSDCIIDELGWLNSAPQAKKGMEQFYKQTGIQPYLYIADNVNGGKYPDNSEIEQFSDEIYDKMSGGNETCVLLLFFEWYDSDVSVYYTAGSAAQTVMDDEACDILCDFAEALYTSDLDDDAYFREIWIRTAERIMKVTPTLASRLPMIIIAIVVIVVVICAVAALHMKYKREKARAEETERILNSPIDRL